MTPALSMTNLEPDSEAVTSTRPAPDEYQSPLVNLRTLKTAVWHRWRIWLAAGLVGMVAGAALHLVLPVKYAAVTDLYLTYPANADPAVSVVNDVSLAQTTAVAHEALDRLHLRMTPASFLSSYTVVAVSSDIISITSSGPSSAGAVARANATAQAFLAVRNREKRLQTGLITSGLQSQISALQSQVGKLTNEITDLSTTGSASSANRLTQLTNQRGADETQISQFQAQAQQAQLDLASVIQGSSIIDPAAPTAVSRKKVIATDGLTGLFIGLGSAMMVLLLSFLLSDRLRTREDVAAVLGAPVELSIARTMRGKPRRRHLAAPPPSLRMIQRRLRHRLEAAPGTALTVVEVGSAEISALAVALLARSLASQDRRVMIVDMAHGRPLAALFGDRGTMKEGQYTLALGGQHLFLVVGPEDPAEAAEKLSVPEGTDAVIILTSIDPAFSVEYLAMWASDAVVLVNAKKASASVIGTTGELLRRAGIAIRSALIIGGDPRDETVGALDADPPPAAEQALGERRPATT